uniref:Putative secreted protein n=1 Tax=Anopheles triannulatus TaxID=58253 RepID=A0A2M4B7P6_9DIPT
MSLLPTAAKVILTIATGFSTGCGKRHPLMYFIRSGSFVCKISEIPQNNRTISSLLRENSGLDSCYWCRFQ